MPLPACRTVVELLGYSGQFDYLEFVAEYAPFDLYSLDNIGRATNMFPHMSAMIKLDQAGRLYWGPRSMGAGFQNILFAVSRAPLSFCSSSAFISAGSAHLRAGGQDPRTVEDVQECVNSVRSECP